MRFNKGFEYMGKMYAWHNKQHNKRLYRLPYKHTATNRWYNLLEVAKWEGKGFILGNHRKSYAQLKEMTKDINPVIIEEGEDIPF